MSFEKKKLFSLNNYSLSNKENKFKKIAWYTDRYNLNLKIQKKNHQII